MSDEVVTLSSSDSEDDVLVQKSPSSEKVRRGGYQDSDDELMNLNLDSPGREDVPKDDEICEIDLESEKVKQYPTKLNPEPVGIYRYDDQYRNLPSVSPPQASESAAIENLPSKKTAPSKKGRAKKIDNSSKAFEKAVKAAETANKKLNKKSDCLKFVTVVIDSQLLNVIPGSGSILVQLQEAEMTHSIAPTSFPKSVHWKREKREYYATEDGQVASTSEVLEEDDGVVVLTAEEFVTEAMSTSIVHYLNNLLRKWKKTHLNLIVFGLAAYHREQSLKEKRRFREQAATQRSNNNKDQGDIEPGLSFNEIEQLKVDIIIQTNYSVWPVESSDELGKIIARLTKAVAERPFKEDRLDQQFDFYVDDYNGGIKVNKEGHGLERLWQQQLMQFPLVALETSQAIASRYPSPYSLYKAYSACNDENEAALLLQDIPIRRHAGPLSTARRVGPEQSRRIHKFMTSKDGASIL